MLFSKAKRNNSMLLSKAKIGQTFNIKSVEGKEKTKKFLFTLGCFEGEEVTLISKLAGNFVINIKDSRYAIDENMAKTIVLDA
ncbi:FeoA family protein [Oceanirhabdus seepicola]|nr:FeoA family protein [Oceanirhabdus seepicola]